MQSILLLASSWKQAFLDTLKEQGPAAFAFRFGRFSRHAVIVPATWNVGRL